MIRIAKPFSLPRRVHEDATSVAQVTTSGPRISSADRAVLWLVACVTVAVACGVVAGVLTMQLGIGDARMTTAVSGLTFSIALGMLLVLRALMNR